MLSETSSQADQGPVLRAAAPAAAMFVVALAWLLLLVPYGFQLEDEGTQLFWFDRVLAGQRPYLDFHTGYTPGYFAFGEAVFAWLGATATAMRTVLALVNAASAALLTELARRVAGPWLAPVPALLWLAFMPVYVGEFAAFNIPYPTWPVTLASVVVALAMTAWIDRPRAAWLVLAGLGAAAAMSLRPNSGAFALAAATWVVVAAASRRTLLDRLAAPAAAAFMLAGIWYAFDLRVAGMDVAVHLVPAAAAALLCAAMLPARLHRGEAPGTTAALALLAASFLAPTVAWMAPLLAELGLQRFLYEVFLVGADYQTLYYLGHPPPEPYALLVVGALVAIAVGGLLVRRGTLRPLTVLLAVAVAGAAVKAFALRAGVAPEGLLHSIVAQYENAAFWLAATANYGLVLWLWRLRGREAALSPRARSMVVAALFGIAMYMQLFPRSDFMHQIGAVPLLAVAACGLLSHVSAWWAAGAWPGSLDGRRVVRAGVLVATAGAVLAGLADKAPGPLEAWTRPTPPVLPERLDVRVEAAAGDEVLALASIVALLRDHSGEGEAVGAFPATSGLLFAAGRRNATPHDYWFPGRPDHDEEARVLDALRREPPRLIVTLNRGWNFFADSPLYFRDLRGFARERYRLVARRGRYDLLARHDVAAAEFGATLMEPPPRPTGPADVLLANLERRRQAAWRWMDSMTPADAAGACLPAGRREALLLLRALRDGGDMRGAAWALLGFESGDERVRGEAVRAMVAMARAHAAARTRLAGDYDQASVGRFLLPWRERLEALDGLPRLGGFAKAAGDLCQQAQQAPLGKDAPKAPPGKDAPKAPPGKDAPNAPPGKDAPLQRDRGAGERDFSSSS